MPPLGPVEAPWGGHFARHWKKAFGWFEWLKHSFLTLHKFWPWIKLVYTPPASLLTFPYGRGIRRGVLCPLSCSVESLCWLSPQGISLLDMSTSSKWQHCLNFSKISQFLVKKILYNAQWNLHLFHIKIIKPARLTSKDQNRSGDLTLPNFLFVIGCATFKN